MLSSTISTNLLTENVPTKATSTANVRNRSIPRPLDDPTGSQTRVPQFPPRPNREECDTAPFAAPRERVDSTRNRLQSRRTERARDQLVDLRTSFSTPPAPQFSPRRLISCESCRSYRRTSARQSHQLGAAKYMMAMVDAAEDFRSISRACTIEKMGTRHGFWSLREIYRESVTGRSPMCTTSTMVNAQSMFHLRQQLAICQR